MSCIKINVDFFRVGAIKVNLGRVYIFLATGGSTAENTRTDPDESTLDDFFNSEIPVSDSDSDDLLKTMIGSKEKYKAVQALNGFSAGGQFGFTIESVDINQDGKDDLVISAPFENNEKSTTSGNVYIFNGQAEESPFAEKPSQILNNDDSKE